MLGHDWREITQDRDSLASVVNRSPVIDEQGEPIGMFIDQKVVSLPELVQSLLSIDSKRLGYWERLDSNRFKHSWTSEFN